MEMYVKGRTAHAVITELILCLFMYFWFEVINTIQFLFYVNYVASNYWM